MTSSLSLGEFKMSHRGESDHVLNNMLFEFMISLIICISSWSKSIFIYMIWTLVIFAEYFNVWKLCGRFCLLFIVFFKKFEYRLFKYNVPTSMPKSSWYFLIFLCSKICKLWLIPNTDYIHHCRRCSSYVFLFFAFFFLNSPSNQSFTRTVDTHPYGGINCQLYTIYEL